jgi:hypothetical protein
MSSTNQQGSGTGANTTSSSASTTTSSVVQNKSTVSSNNTPANAVTAPSEQTSRIPSYPCFQHATKLAIIEDKPIILDYWTSSLEKACLIGVRQNNEKLLVKSEDEYTSPIAKIYKVEGEYIIVTENSIYLVSSDISTRRIN